jgi:exo-beta-1,3-glucanase (GH17 family)
MRSVAAVVALAACLHAGVWAFFQTTGTAPNIERSVASVSYAPFEGIRNPEDEPTAAQIRADLKAIAPNVNAIRTYRSTRGMEQVPAIAAEFGLKVTLGIGLESNLTRDGKYDLVPDPDNPERQITRNEAEIRTAIKLARTYRNIDAIVVGNETTLRRSMVTAAEADEAWDAFARPGSHKNPAAAKDPKAPKTMTFPDFKSAFTQIKKEWEDELREDAAKQRRTVEDLRAEWNVDELMKVIQRVKRQVSVPVTTGETWDIWRDYPKLASSVDFIGAHILPYWDEVTAAQAVDHSLKLFYQLKDQHPGKRIVIAEFGWPSAGYNRQVAEPGRREQATVLRQFVARADALGIDYNIIEAFDQPWKTMEGSVGRYWGIYDASRQPKFSWTGPIGNADYWKIATIAVALGFLISLPILGGAGATMREAVLLTAASHAVGA